MSDGSPWLELVPATLIELYLIEIVSIVIFGLIAMLMGFVHTGRFDLYRVLRNGIGGGVAFPPALLLILYPVSDRVRTLFGADAIKIVLMIPGATTAVLILYGVLKK